MKLEERVNIIPASVLSQYPEMVSKKAQRLDGIISENHWEIRDRNKTN